MSQNRWTERIEQLNDAIRQANEDIEGLTPSRHDLPTVHLPATPISIDVRSVDVPAEIGLTVGKERFVFREELDWAERGHQVALPKLKQVEGDVTPLVPDGLAEDRTERTGRAPE